MCVWMYDKKRDLAVISLLNKLDPPEPRKTHRFGRVEKLSIGASTEFPLL
jgi:hypothetical protein